jgi:hypothetical protein
MIAGAEASSPIAVAHGDRHRRRMYGTTGVRPVNDTSRVTSRRASSLMPITQDFTCLIKSALHDLGLLRATHPLPGIYRTVRPPRPHDES